MADAPGKIESRRGNIFDLTLGPMVPKQFPFPQLIYPMVGKADPVLHPPSHLERRQHLFNAALELLARIGGYETEDRHCAPRFNVGGNLVDYRLW